MEEDEKREVISEFLSEATVSVHTKKKERHQPNIRKQHSNLFQDKDTEKLIDALLSDWKQVAKNKEKEAEEKKAKLIEDARRK